MSRSLSFLPPRDGRSASPISALMAAALALLSCSLVVGCDDDESSAKDGGLADASGDAARSDAAVDAVATADAAAPDAGGDAASTTAVTAPSDAAADTTIVADAVADAAPDVVVPADGAGDAAATGPLPKVLRISPTGHDRFYGVTYDKQGNIFAVGQIASSTDTNADIATVIGKFSSAGVLDSTFGAGGYVVRNAANGTSGELFRAVAVQSTGKIVVAGTIEHVGATDARDRDIAVMRFNADGTKDVTFGTDGIAIFDLSPGAVSGTTYLADSAWGLSLYADDRMVVSGGQVRTGGLDTDFVLLRLSANGVRDATFAANGVFSLDLQVNGVSNNASPRNPTILPGTDGIIGAGYQPFPGGDTSPVVYKVSDTGVLDTTFGTGGAFTTQVLAEQTETYMVAVQPIAGGGYKLVTTGYGRALSTETTDLVSLRLTSAGVIDPSYGTAGIARIDIGGFGDNSRRVMVLPDNRVLLVGGGRLTAADVDGVVAILTPDGQPDTTFAPKGWKTFNLGGPADFFWSVALSPDTKTAASVGIDGVGTAPMPPSANDDAVLMLLPL